MTNKYIGDEDLRVEESNNTRAGPFLQPTLHRTSNNHLVVIVVMFIFHLIYFKVAKSLQH